MSTPAELVIGKFGGHARVAEILGVDVSRVHRWTYPKERGGTGGFIPQRHQTRLLDEARLEGLDLAPADFFPPSLPPAPQHVEAAE
jgi:hypothetical protein